jgi:hypothetical protein
MSDYMENGSPDLLLNESPFRELSLGKATRNTCRLWFTFSFCFFTICHLSASAQSQYQTSTDFAKFAIKLRENGLLTFGPKLESTVGFTMAGRGLALNGALGRHPWKIGIVTTIFWIGERPTTNNPVPNDRSSWDPNWFSNYGGYDDPNSKSRKDFIPMSFLPRQNPFYVGLPYNDVEGGHTKPEAKDVIPWFKDAFVRDGQSVLKGRWLAIRRGERVCFAQWEDCGPFCTDHWQYVFGDERPKANLNQNAGLDVSPAVRDYLGLCDIDVCDWKFVEFREVPPGPWAMYGDNNLFVILRRQSIERSRRRNTANDTGGSGSARNSAETPR